MGRAKKAGVSARLKAKFTSAGKGRKGATQARTSKAQERRGMKEARARVVKERTRLVREAYNKDLNAAKEARGQATSSDSGASSNVVSHKSDLARFSHLYSSRDGSLSVFEDTQGHLTAVNSARLA